MAGGLQHEPDAASKAKIFISYSRKDMVFADRLEMALKARGFEPLIDREGIYAFEDWWKRIQALIGQADTVVFVLSPDAVNSEVALKEVAYAASLNKRFAPIVCRRVEDSTVPVPLRRLNFIFFEDSTLFETSAGQLVEALETDISWIRQHTEYGEAERRWSTATRPTSLLLRSPTLEVAEHWIGSRPRGAPEPTEEIRSFVAQSRRATQVAQRRRRLVQAFIYTLLVGIIVGFVGWINQDYIKAQWHWYVAVRPFLAANVWPYVLGLAHEQALKPGNSVRECVPQPSNDYCPDMVVVPAGSFTMGSPPTEKGRSRFEEPQHEVTIARPFAVGKFAVTFDEWDTCVAYGDCPPGVSDAGFGRGPRPVINVTWHDAQKYAAWLSKITGQPYRLLSEAEYEYAARAGTQTAYPWGDDIGRNRANCDGCGSQWDHQKTAPVGSFAPNGFGLYDMVGNAFSWIEDCMHNDYSDAPIDGSAWVEGDRCHFRITRGGCFLFNPDYLRSAFRSSGSISDTSNFFRGFRVGRTLAAGADAINVAPVH
jgi:formylglycine-generating enzyme required for sulfatase activity